MDLIHSGPQQQDFPVGSGNWAGHSAHTNSFVNLRLSHTLCVFGHWNLEWPHPWRLNRNYISRHQIWGIHTDAAKWYQPQTNKQTKAKQSRQFRWWWQTNHASRGHPTHYSSLRWQDAKKRENLPRNSVQTDWLIDWFLRYAQQQHACMPYPTALSSAFHFLG